MLLWQKLIDDAHVQLATCHKISLKFCLEE